MGRLAIVGATVIDGTGGPPISDAIVVMDGARITSVATAAGRTAPDDAEIIDATGQYVIPGLIDANVHLYAGIVPDLLLEYEGRYAELVEEAAQATLRSGVTTVFDTWGPLEPLTTVRDRVNRGEVVGSRVFVGGNIVGLGGPLSSDFFPPGDVLAPATIDRINRHWEQGVGPELLWLTPDGVRRRVRHYIESSGIDFVKYAASGHRNTQLLTLSAASQAAIVEEAHRAGLTVQAHTTSVESLRMEIEAGVDMLQHGDITGPEPMPDETLKTIVDKQLPVAALVCTERHQEWVRHHGSDEVKSIHNSVKDDNERRLIAAGARLLLTTDGFAYGPRVAQHPLRSARIRGVVDPPAHLGESHVLWLQAVIERGMAPMDALLSATKHVAGAYRQPDLGTLEPGKRADAVILAADPLDDVQNYRRVVAVLKDGRLVDRQALAPHRPETPSTAA